VVKKSGDGMITVQNNVVAVVLPVLLVVGATTAVRDSTPALPVLEVKTACV